MIRIFFSRHRWRRIANEPLADLVLAFEGYKFFCHEKIVEELQTHGFSPDPIPWLEDKIDKGIVRCYSDREILDEIELMFGTGAPGRYFDMLHRSCDAFKSSFFTTFYQALIELPEGCTNDVFLRTLSSCDDQIPNGNSMGENKSFVLAQLLQLKYPGKVVVFCSDDGKARQRMLYIDKQIRALSVLSVFQKLKQDGMKKEDARQYYDSLCDFYSQKGQKAMKVWKAEGSERISVDFLLLFEDIYAGKFEIKGTGDLRYISRA